MNRLKVNTLTLELLAGPTYELMKGSCKSLVELEFFLEEVYKGKTDQLDWNKPEGQQYPHDLLKPLPLIPNSQGHRVIPFDHFINKDLKYLRGGASSRKYTTSVTKTKAVDYGHIKWIEDLGDIKSKSFINREIGQLSLNQKKQHVFNVLNAKSFEISFFEFIEFISNPDAYVPVMNTAEFHKLSATTLPPPSIPIISHVQQTPAPSQANVPSSSLQDLPNFGSLFWYDHRLKTLETNFSEFMQTNQFVEAISSIPGIVDKYLDHQMNKAKIIKEQVKVQVSKILPKIEKTVNEQLEAEVLTRSSNSSKTSYAVAAGLSELELKNILIDKMESNKSIYRSNDQKNLYKALVGTYEWSKSHHKTTSESALAEETMHTTQDLEEPAHQEFKAGATDDKPVEEDSQHPHWFQKQVKPPTHDRAWNKTLPATHGRIQP
nr:hypothetical protein [Tanacetum cinerariifolium]